MFSEQARVSRRFLDGARVVVEAMLQSPNFLFHVEAGSRRPLRGLRRREPAVVPPVEHDAGRGAVRGGGEGRAAARRRDASAPRARMLENVPKGARGARSVLRRVAALRSRRQRGEERNRYPAFTPELALAMAEETRTLLHHLVWNDRNFMEAADGRLQLPHARSSPRCTACLRRRISSRW